MPIDVACGGCGKAFKAPDSAAGKRGRCKTCGTEVSIPAWIPALPASPVAVSEPPPPPKVRRVDPIILAGAIVPCLVLVAAGGYVWMKSAESAERKAIEQLVDSGDAKAKAKKPVSAYLDYDRAFREIGGREKDAEYAPLYTRARAGRLATGEAYDAYAEKKKATDLAEAKRKAESDAAVAALAAIESTYAAEVARLEPHRALISGGSWAVRKDNSPVVLRGLHVYLVRSRVPRAKVAKAIGLAAAFVSGNLATRTVDVRNGAATNADRDNAARVSKVLETLRALQAYDGTVDFLELRQVIRDASTVNAIGDEYLEFETLLGDILWPMALSSAADRDVHASIDGRFAMPDLPGGRYYVCARHVDPQNFVDWVAPILVDRSGEITFQLFNETAAEILNRPSEEARAAAVASAERRRQLDADRERRALAVQARKDFQSERSSNPPKSATNPEAHGQAIEAGIEDGKALMKAIYAEAITCRLVADGKVALQFPDRLKPADPVAAKARAELAEKTRAKLLDSMTRDLLADRRL